MGADSNTLHTICIQTKDAVQHDRKTGEFTFRLNHDPRIVSGSHIALGSLEFPMVQFSIEADGDRLYYHRGCTIDPPLSLLEFSVLEADGTAPQQCSVQLPLTLNPITRWDSADGHAVVTCERPHGLWSASGACVLPTITWGTPAIIAANVDTGPVGHLLVSASRVSRVSEYAFAIQGVAASASAGGYLHLPAPPALSDLARLLTHACHKLHHDLSVRAHYNAAQNRMAIAMTSERPVHVLWTPTPLSRRLGIGGAARKVSVARLVDWSGDGHTEQVAWWSHVSLASGWYTPSHRPMCTGRPLDICAELETSLNRLYFPLPEKVVSGEMTDYHLVFEDPCCRVMSVAVPSGMYSPLRLCAFLESAMTTLARASIPSIAFDVTYDQGRYTFACHIGSTAAEPATFALLFAHPRQFDPRRIGFGRTTYCGSSSYTSPLYAAAMDDGGAAGSVYRVSELAEQKRLQLHAYSGPNVTGVVRSYDPQRRTIALKTHVGILPYAHGLTPDTVVYVCRSRANAILAPSGDGSWVETTVTPCTLDSAYGRAGVVVAHGDAADCCTLHLAVKGAHEWESSVGQTIDLRATRQPLNICTDVLPNTLKSPQLGFRAGATEDGQHGTVMDGRRRMVPPFVAPAVHNLDHPDYVLMYMDCGNHGTMLTHVNGSLITTPFTKIVFYPNLREERNIPRDTTLISGESIRYIKVRFTNPDGSAYKFHGAQFSFSLNLVVQG